MTSPSAPMMPKICLPKSRLTTPKSKPTRMANTVAWMAIRFASALFFAPKYLEIREDVPTPKAMKIAK